MQPDAETWPVGVGAAAAVREAAWGQTPLGAATSWPPALRTAVELVLSMPQAACVCWGADARIIYNDDYRAILGARHPQALGQPLARVWREVEDQIADRLARVLRGEPQVWEDAPYQLDTDDGPPATAWFTATWTPIRSGADAAAGFLIVATETTARHHAEAELRHSQDRHAFLLNLADALRPLGEASEIQSVAARALGLRLDADRVGYAEDLGGDEIAVTRNYVRGAPSIEGRYRYDDYGPDLLRALRQGRAVIRPDVAGDESLTVAEKAAHAVLQLGATANIPLLKDGELRAVLFVHFQAPHAFDEAEIDLMRDVAERTWAEVMRTRAEQEMRRSEARYRTLFSSMDEGYCIIQMLHDDTGEAVDWRFIEVNRAFETHNGLTAAAGRTIREMAPDIERKWIDIYNRVAETGESLRFQEVSGALQDRVFDLYAFRVDDPAERKVAVLFTNITEAKHLADRQAILLAELQHRVRNTLAMIRAISERTIRGSPSLEAFGTAWRGRLAILSRVQALLTRSANLGVDLGAILAEELAAHAADAAQYSIEGPDLTLPPKAAEVLTLAVHELATNALKHGALSTPSGRIEISWSLDPREDGPWLTFAWRETVGQPLSAALEPRKGFGRDLIERRIPYDLHGRSTLTIAPLGASCVLEFPWRNSASVLETSIPDRDTLFENGGKISAGPDFSKYRILVVEDDFLLADDVTRVLTRAGAKVLGPFPSEGAALSGLIDRPPTLAVLDVNLGHGPSFDLARGLRSRAIPFVFLTGYDDIIFPEDLADAPRLKKPADAKRLLAVISSLVGS